MSPVGRTAELGFLRQVVNKLVIRPISPSPFSQETLRAAGLVRGKITPNGLLGLLPGGNEPLQLLSDQLFSALPGVERGVRYPDFEAEVFSQVIAQFSDRPGASIGIDDVNGLWTSLETWFAKRVTTRTVFVPCMISPWPSPEFRIGPVLFTFLEDVKKKYTDPSAQDWRELHLNSLLEAAARDGAHWMAEVDITGCDTERSQEVANLAVDLAIIAIQLAMPYMGVKNMSRLFDRRGTGQVVTAHRAHGIFSGGFFRVDPGTAIGPNFLAKVVNDTAPLIRAVGHCVNSYSTGSYRLPVIEQAWCDAAYWLQQGLVEAIDSIAVAKLETAIEVLLKSESGSGSEKRMLLALNAFFGLNETDTISPTSQTTAKQFAKGFVRDRSRILHGTWSTLNARLNESRSSLEHVAMTIIRASAIEIDQYANVPGADDDVEKFMSWISNKREHASP